MTCSGGKQSCFGRNSCGLFHMTRMVDTSWVLLRGFQLVVCLVCTTLPTVFVSSQACRPERSFDSPFLQASYREEADLDVGCQTSNGTLSRQTHILNYKMMHPGPSPANILVNIDSGSAYIQTIELVLVLNSNVSVEWEVKLKSPAHLTVPRFEFVISRTSSLNFASQGKQYRVTNTTSPPVDDQELLTWVRNELEYDSISSFSAFHDVDEVTILVKTDASAPAACDLTSHRSPWKGYTVEDQSIWGCAPGSYDVINRRQIHVIEILSPKKYVGDNSKEQVEVSIQKDASSEEGPRDTLLILVSHLPTLWNIHSPEIDGNLTIISNNKVDVSSSLYANSTAGNQNNVDTRKGLLKSVEEQYGPVSSYSYVRVANQFQVYIAGPVPVISTTPLVSLEDGDAMIDPSWSGDTELADSINSSCHTPHIHILVPVDTMIKYNILAESVTWRDQNCSANLTESGLELTAGISMCGSNYSADLEHVVVSNQVTIYSASGSEGSGMTPFDDDEDSSVQILYQRTVTCTFDLNKIPWQTFEPTSAPSPSDNILHLELYTDSSFAWKKKVKPYRLEIGDPVYFEMSVTGDPRLNIIMGECWIGLPQEKLFKDKLAAITENGCPVESTFRYLPVQYKNYQTEMAQGTVKRFTFNVPKLADYVMTFYVFCNLSVCTTEPWNRYSQCSSLPVEHAPCSGWQQLKPWPMKQMEIGPFRITSREIYHDKITGTGAPSENSRKGEAGTLSVKSSVFVVVIFISFFIGVLLVSSLWLITKYTRVPSPSSSANSPVGNGHIPNGHLPNGEARYEMQPFMQDGVNPNNIPHEGLYDGCGDPEA